MKNKLIYIIAFSVIACVMAGCSSNKSDEEELKEIVADVIIDDEFDYDSIGIFSADNRTLEAFAFDAEISLKELYGLLGLPEGFPKDRTLAQAKYMMPAEKYIKMCLKQPLSFEEFKEKMGLPDTTTPLLGEEGFEPVSLNEETPWYIVEGELTVGGYIVKTEEELQQFKQYYALDEAIFMDTKVKEIKNKLNKSMANEQYEDFKASLNIKKEENDAQTAN